jgi:hypothetical protein
MSDGLTSEFLSSNLVISYPFADPAPNVTVGGNPVALGSLFADAVLFVKSKVEQRIALKHFEFNPASGYVEIQLTFEDGSALFTLNSFSHTSRTEVFGRWIIVELSDGDNVVRFVLPDTVGALSFTVSGNGAVIEPSLIVRAPNEVTGHYLKVGNDLFALEDTLVLDEGYNFDIAQQSDEGTDARPIKVIRMSAPPGGGRGPFVKPADQINLQSVAGAGPGLRGNLDLVGPECYTITPTPENNEVDLRVICGQCCSCENYVTVYEGLASLWNQALAISLEINQKYEAYKELAENIIALGGGGGGVEPILIGRVQSRPNFYIDIAWAFINGSAELPAGTEVKVQISMVSDPVADPPPDSTYIEPTGQLIFQDGDGEEFNPTGIGSVGDPYEFDITSYDHVALATTTWTGNFRASLAMERETDPTMVIEFKLLIDGAEVEEQTQEVEIDLLQALQIE